MKNLDPLRNQGKMVTPKDPETVYLTREGLEKVRRELERLVKEVRPAATAELEAARTRGDLFENADYDAARENLTDIDRRIGELQQRLSRVHIIEDHHLSSGEVRILSRVKLMDLGRGREMEYTLVDPVQADPSRGLISLKSPIGKGLLGRRTGDEVKIDTPSGELRLKVLAIERSEGL